jgi:hypothetical protein
VIGGARVTGKVGSWTLGALNMETDRLPEQGVERTNFSVFRLRRDILRRSDIGAIYTRRSVSTVAPGDNNVWGVDANFSLYNDVFFNTYLAQSLTDGHMSDNLSYRTLFHYSADRYGLEIDRLVVDPNFNPEVGLLRRDNFRRNFGQARFSPRPKNNRFVRKLTMQSGLAYVTDNNHLLESRAWTADFISEFHTADEFRAQYARMYEFIPEPFSVARGVRIAAGPYNFQSVKLTVSGDQHRFYSGTAMYEVGSFYDGDKQTATVRGRIAAGARLGVEPNLSLNWVDLPQASFTAKVIGARTTYTISPRSYIAALVQYDSNAASVSTNLRLRWEYRPGSELFLVYTEGRSTLPVDHTELQSRGIILKINRLFRF